MIAVTSDIGLEENEIHMDYVRSSGPGGQNVNKVATAVQLRFDVAQSPSLPETVRERLTLLAGSRITREGVLIINARRFRTQERNRQDAINRLVELIREATVIPKPRRKTKASQAAKQRRLNSKKRQTVKKQLRQTVSTSSE